MLCTVRHFLLCKKISQTNNVNEKHFKLKSIFKKEKQGIPWWSRWLGHHPSTAGDTGSIPGWGTKIPKAFQCCQKKKKNGKEKQTNAKT